MKQSILISFFSCSFLFLHSQWRGEVLASGSGDVLAGATITIYSGGKISGLVANKEGKFSITSGTCDSVKISMVGYHSKTLLTWPGQDLKIQLEPAPAELEEVVIKKSSALDIIHKTIAAIPSFQPDSNFENKGF